MPSRSVGTVFVELDMDPSRYVKSQKRLYKDATSTTLNIEANFKKLGIKSSAEMDLMRAKVTNSFNMIKNSAKATANDIVRAEKAKNEQLARLNEMQYGKQTSMLQKLKSHWMGIGVAITAVTAITRKYISAAMEQEEAEMKLAVAMGNAGTYTRENFRAMKDYAAQLQKVTKYGDEVTMATMANLETYGMNTEELKRSTIATMNLASAKGIDLKAASELVGKAFVGETGTLSRYGIVLDKGIEKTEKFEAVLKLINERFGGTAQAELETYSGQWKQMANWWGDIGEKVGFGLLKALEAIQFAVGMVGAGFYTVLETITSSFATLIGFLEKLPMIGAYFTGFRKGLDNVTEGFELGKQASLEFASKNLDMLKSFERVEDFADKTFKNIAKSSEDSSEDIMKHAKEIGRETYRSYGYTQDQILQHHTWRVSEEYKAEVAAQKKAEALRKKEAEEKARLEEKIRRDAYRRLQTTKTMYDDLDGFAYESYQTQRDLLIMQREDYKKLVGKDAIVNEWYHRKLRQSWIESGKQSEDFVWGIDAAITEQEDAWVGWGSASYGVMTAFVDDAKSSLKDGLFDYITGETKDLSGLFESSWKMALDETLRMTIDWVTSMIAQYATLETATKAFNVVSGWLGFASGTWAVPEGKGTDKVPAFLTPGEIVIPAEESAIIRQSWGGDFSQLAEAFRGAKDWADMSQSEKENWEAFKSGAFQPLPGTALKGLTLFSQNAIGLGDFVAGMGLYGVMSAVFSGVPNAIANKQGWSSDPAKWVGNLLAMAGGITGGPVGWAAGKLFGSWLGERVGDALNIRDMEHFLDMYEDQGMSYGGAKDALAKARDIMALYGFDPNKTAGYGSFGYGGDVSAYDYGDYTGDTPYDAYRWGGLARKPSVFAEYKPEWAIPATSPERETFLRSTGIEDAFIRAMEKAGGSTGPVANFHFHGPVYTDDIVATTAEVIDKVNKTRTGKSVQMGEITTAGLRGA